MGCISIFTNPSWSYGLLIHSRKFVCLHKYNFLMPNYGVRLVLTFSIMIDWLNEWLFIMTVLKIFFPSYIKWVKNKYNCSGSLAFKTHRVGHQSNQKSLSALKIFFPSCINWMKNKYNCSGSPAFKTHRVGYQSNQKSLLVFKKSPQFKNSFLRYSRF